MRLTDEQVIAARDYGRKTGDFTEEALATEVLESRAEIARLTKGRDEVGVRQFNLGERVTKIKGSSWTGRVVGFYSTTLTPEGYAVESETERGSVQIYPAAAIRAMKGDKP